MWTDERVSRWKATGQIPSPVMVWTPAQTGAFLDHAAAADDYWYALCHVVAYRGLRRGEACGLHWTDIDLDAAQLVVRWQIAQLGWATSLKTPKTDSSEDIVALDAETVTVLRAHLGIIAARLGATRDAVPHAETAYRLSLAAGNRCARATAANNMAWLYGVLGEHSAAMAYGREALTIFEDLGDVGCAAEVWTSLDDVHFNSGNPDAAHDCYRRAFGVFREISDRTGEARATPRSATPISRPATTRRRDAPGGGRWRSLTTSATTPPNCASGSASQPGRARSDDAPRPVPADPHPQWTYAHRRRLATPPGLGPVRNSA